MTRESTEGVRGRDSSLYDTAMVGTCHYTLVPLQNTPHLVGGACALCPLPGGKEGESYGSLRVDSSSLSPSHLPGLVPGISLRGEDNSMLSPTDPSEVTERVGGAGDPRQLPRYIACSQQSHPQVCSPRRLANVHPETNRKELTAHEKMLGITGQQGNAHPNRSPPHPQHGYWQKSRKTLTACEVQHGNIVSGMGTAVDGVRGTGGLVGGSLGEGCICPIITLFCTPETSKIRRKTNESNQCGEWTKRSPAAINTSTAVPRIIRS